MNGQHRREGALSTVERIVSGGQSGADRGGLDAAIALGLSHGGWCPKGRRAEDGVVPEIYGVQEMLTASYAARTKRNVIDSDATVIFTRGALFGGCLLTARAAEKAAKPLCHIDFNTLETTHAARELRAWLERCRPRTLNVAGSRESDAPGIQEVVAAVLEKVLAGSEQVAAK